MRRLNRGNQAATEEPLLLQQRGHLGREPINSEWSADVRFAAHYGLNSDIELGPKSAMCGHSRMLKHIAELFAIEKDIRGRSPRSDVSFDNREAARRCIPEVATHIAWSDQSEGQARRRHPLCALALGGTNALP